MLFVNCYAPDEIFNIFLETLTEEKELYDYTCECAESEGFVHILIYRRHKSGGCWDIFYELDIPVLIEKSIWSQFGLVDGEVCESIIFNNNRNFVITKGYEAIITKFQGMLENKIAPVDQKRFEEFVRVLKELRLQSIMK
ncbi:MULTISPECIES: hypothetical protein [Bacillus cereus group]|uniref:hypothetical protein n=1 Tax=Bacillus cereus group TaxID=86661 RepID=UPI0021D2C3C1|nr:MULTISPECIES: hypothetical protein [Bacillus cereus group]MCU5201667.1 hypothetical protein [Bacillus paranthracis]MCU5374695.1 hypothetical protein [Bacillus pacificus]